MRPRWAERDAVDAMGVALELAQFLAACHVPHAHRVVVAASSGQPLAGSFMDYAMPRADMLPSFATEIAEVLSPTNPLGIKAGGEGGTTPALAVVINAIIDALSGDGVTHIDMPATPENVWQALATAKAA